MAGTHRFEVVIRGGAFAGASAAIPLRRLRPDHWTLVIEPLAAFDAKQGPGAPARTRYRAPELDHIAFGRSYHRFVEAVYRGRPAVEPGAWTPA